MTPSRWQEIKSLLNEMDELPPTERQDWLIQRCRTDSDLLRNVELFLGHETQLAGFMEDSAASHLQLESLDDPWEGESGKRIGPYRVMDLLGRGGMGAVYEAIREDDFEQRVALKLVLAGRDHPRILQLFQNERQILARLEHPNIARLLDGGADWQGRPYFAMELIEGEPIDQYCDHNCLSLRQRLELILHVCDALQMAHRNLVVHRDIKPGNILVDQGGTPKLLDFGIAKLIEPNATLATQSGSQPLTLFYASPEQLSNEPITPASDLYSLGVLLYRLLTGVLPNDLENLGYLKLVLAVCKEEPRSPSDVVTTRGDGRLAEIAKCRSTDPARLRSGLAGDLDAILLKTLRKEPEQRYDSVDKLADDIRRFLDGRPVAARNGNWAYKSSKFMRRNRWPLAIGTVVFMVILTLSTLFVQQAGETEKERDRAERERDRAERERDRAERERDRAEKVKDFLMDLMGLSDPYVAETQEESRAWATRLEMGRHLLESSDEIQNEDRADLLNGMAHAYHSLKLHSDAESLLKEVLPIYREVYGEQSVEVATALADLGVARFNLGDLVEAEQFFRRSIDMRRGIDDGYTGTALSNLAAVYRYQGKVEQAEEVFRELLKNRRALFEHNPLQRKLIGGLRSLGAILLDQGKLEEAESLLREAIELCEAMVQAPEIEFSDNDQEYVDTRVTLGRVVQEAGNPREALELFEQVASMRRSRLGDQDRDVALVEKDLASAYMDLGQWDKAELALASAREILLSSDRSMDRELADLDSLSGALAVKRGRVGEARELLGGAREYLQAKAPGTRQARLADQRWQRFLELREATQ